MITKKKALILYLATIAIMGSAIEARSAMSNTKSIATFGGGCFWCIEAIFDRLDGVEKARSGYAGGHEKKPTYRAVTGGKTGHAEVVQVHFDPEVVTYEELLELFWQAHDPTSLNRQGADIGPQYRSIILFHDEEQRASAEVSKAAAQKHFSDPIVTEIIPLEQFYVAEDYHQNYYEQNPDAGYCSFVIRPKLKKLGMDPQPQKP